MTRRQRGEGRPVGERVADFETRQRAAGRTRLQVWIDADLLTAWQEQATALPLPASASRLDRLNQVLRRWHNAAQPLTNVAERSITMNKRSASLTNRSATSTERSVTAGRYMPEAVEDRMLELLDSGLTLGEVGQRLGAEGVVSPTTGQPYDSRTVHRACERARRRRDSSRA